MAVQRAADGLVALVFLDALRFAGNERFVHIRLARFNHAIHGHALAWTDAHEIANPQVVERHLYLPTFSSHSHHVRLQIQQFLHRLRTAGFHNQREPFGKNMVGEHHDRYREKRRGRKSRWVPN